MACHSTVHSARTSRKTVKLALAFSTSIILYLVVAVSGFLGLVADYQNAAAINTEEYAVAANVLRVCTAITLAAWIGTVIFAVLTMKNLVDTLRKSQAFYDERSRTSFDGKAVGEYRDGKDCESGYSDDSLIEFNEKI
ncbi:MAG: hypothetical protein M1827_006539 [Pycnora praestabilis]|nr:MAG: hypothetical protein M1827_006539 [Pycnora praestabilis]